MAESKTAASLSDPIKKRNDCGPVVGDIGHYEFHHSTLASMKNFMDQSVLCIGQIDYLPIRYIPPTKSAMPPTFTSLIGWPSTHIAISAAQMKVVA